MDAFRHDPMTDSWVAIVPRRRGAAKHLASPGTLPTLPGRCPFCPGHEKDTEETVAQVPERGEWRVRAVRNLYPIAVAEAASAPPPGAGESLPAWGAHEVIVESREHDLDLTDMAVTHLADVLRLYRGRLEALTALEGVRTVALFRNRGRRAGSSQPHPHAQIAACVAPAPDPVRRAEVARRHHRQHGDNLLEVVVERELEAGVRIVEETPDFVVLTPYAPHFTVQTWVAPRRPLPSFADVDDGTLASLAEVLRRTLRRVRAVTDDAAYNLVFRIPPVDAPRDASAFWYLDVLPRRGGDAGYELSTGMAVVTVSPEEAAERLRSISPP